MKMDVLTATNGDALKCVIKKDNGFVNVKNPVPLRKRGAPLIPMKINGIPTEIQTMLKPA